jgi:HEAT repeat protein
LQRALRSGNRHERAEAAIELGRLADSQAAAELERLLDDPDDLVAVSAMFGCWLLDGGAVETTRAVAALASDDEETVQAAVQALCEIGETIVPGLIRQLEAESDHSPEIVRVLGDIGGARALEAVRRAGGSADSRVAAEALCVLEDWDEGEEDRN